MQMRNNVDQNGSCRGVSDDCISSTGRTLSMSGLGGRYLAKSFGILSESVGFCALIKRTLESGIRSSSISLSICSRSISAGLSSSSCMVDARSTSTSRSRVLLCASLAPDSDNLLMGTSCDARSFSLLLEPKSSPVHELRIPLTLSAGLANLPRPALDRRPLSSSDPEESCVCAAPKFRLDLCIS